MRAHDERPLAICLLGPTASGKTALALALDDRLGCGIVSVDSAQIYRGMDIGTAKPDRALLARHPHRLIDIRDPAEVYSAAEFRADALVAIAEVLAAGRTPLLVGGSMLYFRQTQGVLPELMRAGGGNLVGMPSLKLMEHRLMEAMRRFLARRRAQLDVPDLDAAVYVSYHAASAVISRHLLEPDWLRDEEIVEEIVRLMLRYFGVQAARM